MASSPEPLHPIEVASRDELASLQLQRLQWSVKHAFDNVALRQSHYATTLLRGIGVSICIFRYTVHLILVYGSGQHEHSDRALYSIWVGLI